MDLTIFLIQCLNSLQYGLLLFLVASGLTLIFGIMGVINLAHGSFYMVGAYLAFSLAPVVGATIGGGFFATLLVGVARYNANNGPGLPLKYAPEFSAPSRSHVAFIDDFEPQPLLRYKSD